MLTKLPRVSRDWKRNLNEIARIARMMHFIVLTYGVLAARKQHKLSSYVTRSTCAALASGQCT